MNTERNERVRSSYLRVLVSIQKWIGERQATRAYLCRLVHFPFGPRVSTVSGRQTRSAHTFPRPRPGPKRKYRPRLVLTICRAAAWKRLHRAVFSNGRRSWIFIFIGTPHHSRALGGGRCGPGEQGEVPPCESRHRLPCSLVARFTLTRSCASHDRIIVTSGYQLAASCSRSNVMGAPARFVSAMIR
jgi:hypothetical protein